MNLGLAGRRAVVCGSSAGLGLACAEALLAEGAHVVLNGRHTERLDAVATRLRITYGDRVAAVAADITCADGRAALLVATDAVDVIVTNGAGPEPQSFATLDEAVWRAALEATMIAPLMLIHAVLPGMRARRFGRIVVISSAMVTTPRADMALSSGGRAGLLAALKAAATAAAVDNVTINALAPERFDTNRQLRMAHGAMARDGIDLAEARGRQVATIPAGRLGRPEEFGATCAFMCSDHAGYMTGMNVRLDGGSYPGMF